MRAFFTCPARWIASVNARRSGTATADALGNWLLDFILPSTAGVMNPSNTGLNSSTGFWCSAPKTLQIKSNLGGVATPNPVIQLK